jgi:uncharacterized protein YbjQ (UPF0145 family)
MAKDLGKCPTCSKSLSENRIMMPDEMVEIIKQYNPQTNYSICTKCGHDILAAAVSKIDVTKTAKVVEELKKSIPIVSIHSPAGWEYEVLGIVTAQSVIGTGAIAEFTASIADFFGKESPSFVKKIIEGETSSFSQLIQKTINMEGNAVVGVDVDYSELGSFKGMIMVCMTGTAVRVRNLEVLGPGRREAISKLHAEILKYKHETETVNAYWKHNMYFPN